MPKKRFGNVFTEQGLFYLTIWPEFNQRRVVVMHENLFPTFANGKVISDDIIDYKVSFILK